MTTQPACATPNPILAILAALAIASVSGVRAANSIELD
jgi:hypothetical protein